MSLSDLLSFVVTMRCREAYVQLVVNGAADQASQGKTSGPDLHDHAKIIAC